MRWITLFALFASLASGIRAAEAAATDDAAAAAEAEPELEGVVVERPDGTFMTVTMDGTRALLSFFDAKKKPIAPVVERAFVKFRLSGRRPENRTLLPDAEGMSLTHGRPLRPPFVFRAFITLVHEDGDAEVDDEDEEGDVADGERHQISYP